MSEKDVYCLLFGLLYCIVTFEKYIHSKKYGKQMHDVMESNLISFKNKR